VLDGAGSTDASLRRQAADGTPPSELTGLVQKIRERVDATGVWPSER